MAAHDPARRRGALDPDRVRAARGAPAGLAGRQADGRVPASADFHRKLAEEPKNATLLVDALYEVTGRRLALAFAVGERSRGARRAEEPLGEDEILELVKETFDARELKEEETTDGHGHEQDARQVQQMQAEMAKAQEELANEIVEASAGGGMVTVKANGAGEITEIKIAPKAIDPDDPELLADMVHGGRERGDALGPGA